jgi:Rod binding domain-containing protein
MDGADLIFNQPVMSLSPLDESKLVQGKKTEQAAKDFESVLVTKLLDDMKDTVGQWGFEEDAASGQVKGLFWLYLARDISDKGGLGLWKDLNRFFTDMQTKSEVEGQNPAAEQSLNEGI